MVLNKIFEFTDKNFEQKILLEKKYILVDFWADWCNPCKILSPLLDELVDQYSENLIIGKINIEKNPEIPVKYSIRSIPTLLLFYKSNIVATQIGALSKNELIDFLNKNIT